MSESNPSEEDETHTVQWSSPSSQPVDYTQVTKSSTGLRHPSCSQCLSWERMFGDGGVWGGGGRRGEGQRKMGKTECVEKKKRRNPERETKRVSECVNE